MQKKTMVIICSLMLAMTVLSFAKEKKEPGRNLSANELVNEKAKFKRTRSLFNNKANKEIRAKRLAEKQAAEAEEAKKKVEEAQDKGEGQVKVQF